MRHSFIRTLFLASLLLVGTGQPVEAAQYPAHPFEVIFNDGTGTLKEIAFTAGLEKDADPVATLGSFILWLLSFVALLAMLAIVWGGIMYILSFGNEARAALGKRIILVALIGLAISLLSYVIIATVQTLTAVV